MRKAVSVFIMLALLTMLFAGCTETPQPDAPAASTELAGLEIINIGILEPFTGANGAGGKQEALGMLYAQSIEPTVEINGVTYLVELVTADAESSREKAPTAAEMLVNENVSLVLGPSSSDEAIAASPIFEAAGIPAIGVTCTNPAVTAGNSHYFRICWLDTFQGSVLANFANEHLGAQKVYCLAERNDPYSSGLCSYFITAFTELGGTVVYDTFPEGTTDFTPYIQAAKREGADTFFSPVTTESAAWIIVQADDEQLNMPILAGDSWDSNVIAAAGKNEDADIYITTFFNENGQSQQSRDFVAGFKAFVNSNEYYLNLNGGNDMLSAKSAMGYDAYFVALEAIRKAGSADPAAIQEALSQVDYTGITGQITFDQENGDAVRNAAFIKQVNKDFGTWSFVKVQEMN